MNDKDQLIEFAKEMHELAKKYNIDIKTTEQQELTKENLDKFFKKMEDAMESERKIPSIPPEYLMIINDDNQNDYRVFKVEKDRTGECTGYTVMVPNVSPDVIKKLDAEYEIENIKRKYLSPKIPMEKNEESKKRYPEFPQETAKEMLERELQNRRTRKEEIFRDRNIKKEKNNEETN